MDLETSVSPVPMRPSQGPPILSLATLKAPALCQVPSATMPSLLDSFCILKSSWCHDVLANLWKAVVKLHQHENLRLRKRQSSLDGLEGLTPVPTSVSPLNQTPRFAYKCYILSSIISWNHLQDICSAPATGVVQFRILQDPERSHRRHKCVPRRHTLK